MKVLETNPKKVEGKKTIKIKEIEKINRYNLQRTDRKKSLLFEKKI